MCGTAGIQFYNEKAGEQVVDTEKILGLLKHRGPDSNGSGTFGSTTLFHTRLVIVDKSEASNQPFTDSEKKSALVYNGEIFNYISLRVGISGLYTTGDTEVLFRLLQKEGAACLNKLNGFFSFAYYDEPKKTLFLARDRYGVKPLYYYSDDNKFAFASELKPLMELAGKQELNYNMVYTYFRLNYCAGNETMFKNVYRLLPGQCITIVNGKPLIETWYKAPKIKTEDNLFDLLDSAVKMRLNADVPLGTFLSGGLDSSIISALAIRHKPDLNTFSIGFDRESYFDETIYSEQVAKHIGSNHHVFKLKEDDFMDHINDFLSAIDEPFADSSAFNLYMLSKLTKQHVKVALSGDGADELFKGYYKHKALVLCGSERNKLFVRALSGVFSGKKSSRDGMINNKVRQFKKFEHLIQLPDIEKQKFLATISGHAECATLVNEGVSSLYFDSLFKQSESFAEFALEDTFDMQTVLADDMLVKTDRFSMRHGLEVRNPFLDYRVDETENVINS